ncbi:hypothetical protein CC2G_006929 [Coprinopsis cinerea AmutBmut pab1-1]|nr:hypothetical protein CC2G_006929 [Coprinopsis cinerea AmutBmut pab1-1]
MALGKVHLSSTLCLRAENAMQSRPSYLNPSPSQTTPKHYLSQSLQPTAESQSDAQSISIDVNPSKSNSTLRVYGALDDTGNPGVFTLVPIFVVNA